MSQAYQPIVSRTRHIEEAARYRGYASQDRISPRSRSIPTPL